MVLLHAGVPVHDKVLSGINSSGTKVTSKVSLMFCVYLYHILCHLDTPGLLVWGTVVGDSFQREHFFGNELLNTNSLFKLNFLEVIGAMM